MERTLKSLIYAVWEAVAADAADLMDDPYEYDSEIIAEIILDANRLEFALKHYDLPDKKQAEQALRELRKLPWAQQVAHVRALNLAF